MNYHAHRIGGICTGLAFSLMTSPQINPLPYSTIITASALLGSLLPDIDEPNSFVGKKVKPLSKFIKMTAGHRGIFHTLIICGLFPSIYYLIKDIPEIQPYIRYISWIIIGLTIGYISHLLMDMMTISGVPLLWPFFKKRISILPLKTNRDEWIAILIFIFITFILILAENS